MQAAGGMGAMGGMGGIDQQALQEAMLFQAMTQIEAAVDAELERTENLTEDDLATIRRNRVAEMKRKASEKQEWEHNGHGKFTKVNDQKEFFEATKKSSHTVCMFTRKGNKWGDVMKQHFELLVRRRRRRRRRRRAAAASPPPAAAHRPPRHRPPRAQAQKHMECRFIWVDAEAAPFITEKLNIWMLPTICCIKNNKIHKQHSGLNEIDGTGKYTSGMLEYLLKCDEMIEEAPLYEREMEEEEEELELDDD